MLQVYLYPMQVDVGVAFNPETPARFLQPHLKFLIPDAVYRDINPRALKRNPPRASVQCEVGANLTCFII